MTHFFEIQDGSWMALVTWGMVPTFGLVSARNIWRFCESDLKNMLECRILEVEFLWIFDDLLVSTGKLFRSVTCLATKPATGGGMGRCFTRVCLRAVRSYIETGIQEPSPPK